MIKWQMEILAKKDFKQNQKVQQMIRHLTCNTGFDVLFGQLGGSEKF